MRIIMMGTGPFAVPTFRHLVASSHSVPLLVTRPVAARRAMRPPAAPMRQEAERLQVPLFDPPDVNDPQAAGHLAQLQPDLLVVCDYGQILSAEVLATARLGGINLHGSLLPRYRGAAPVNWALWHGETVTGVSVIHMTPKLDAGPILAERRLDVGRDMDAVQLEERLAELGPQAVDQAIDLLASWPGEGPIGTAQDKTQATSARRLRKEDGQIDWTRSAEQIYDQIRALKPWPGTYTFWYPEGQPPLRLLIDQAKVQEEPAGAPPGVVVESGPLLAVATGKGRLQILRLQAAGKKMMDVEAFLRGHPVKPGDRMGPQPAP